MGLPSLGVGEGSVPLTGGVARLPSLSGLAHLPLAEVLELLPVFPGDGMVDT